MVRHSFAGSHCNDLTIKRDAFMPVTDPVNTELSKTDVPYGSEFYVNTGVQVIDDPMIEISNFILITEFILCNYACNYQVSRLPPIESIARRDVIFV